MRKRSKAGEREQESKPVWPYLTVAKHAQLYRSYQSLGKRVVLADPMLMRQTEESSVD